MPSTHVTKQELNTYPAWSPRFWHGMAVSSWLRLMLPRLHRIHPLRMPMALIVTGCSVVNSVLSLLQKLVYGRAIARTELDQAPIFILGHWRSGTTYLHELLVLDERFAFPTTYECFAPTHFVLTGRLLPRLLAFLLPAKRPNDDMIVSFSHPQEDEFALLALGAPSPILRLAFPNDPPMHMEMLDMEGVSEPDLARWKRAMFDFILRRRISRANRWCSSRRPTPAAFAYWPRCFRKRNSSTSCGIPIRCSLPRAGCGTRWNRCKDSRCPGTNTSRTTCSLPLNACTVVSISSALSIEDSRICEVRYEDLVKDPVGELRRIYQQLDLGDFEHVRDKIAASVNDRKTYRTTPHSLEEPIKTQIRRRWGKYFEKYGYATDENVT